MAAKKLQGQVAIVTGASRGIGAAAAMQLAQAGAGVILVARDELLAEKQARFIREQGGQAEVVPADVSDPESIEPIIEVALDQFRRIDILVNNAGVIWPIDEVAEADLDEWAYNVHVNLVGPFYLMRTVLPVMQAQEYGRIVNVSSGAATHPVAGWSAYCAAKAGLDMLTKTAALELRAGPITVNALHPGLVNTDMQDDIRSVDTDGSSLDFDRFHAAYAEGNLRTPDAVARMIYWMVGPWSRGRSGEIFTASDPAWLESVDRDILGYHDK